MDNFGADDIEMDELNGDVDEDAQTETRTDAQPIAQTNTQNDSAETSFGGLSPGQKLINGMIGDLYSNLGVNGDVNLVDIENFETEKTSKGFVQLKLKIKGGLIPLKDERTGKWYAYSTLKKLLGGENAVALILGLESTPVKKAASAKKAAANNLNDTLTKLDETPDKDLPKTARKLENQLSNSGDLLPRRELLALDKALRTIRGELENNLGKLGDLNHMIAERERELTNLDISEFGGDQDQFESVKEANEKRYRKF